MTPVAIVILNYNGEKFLRQFLPSVLAHSAGADVYVADNGSTDHSVPTVRGEFPTVRLIELDQNYGFCGGYNRALSRIQSKYYVLLNSDVEVTAGWLQPLLTMAENDGSIAAIQPKILSYHKRESFEYAGAAGGFIDSMGYPFCRGRLFRHLESDRGQYNDSREIFWASGACLFIRSTVFHELGGLDEDFFAHMEEIDLCWKINRTGHRVMYCGQSTVYHVGAGTLAYESPQKTFLNFKNGLSMVYKQWDSAELVYKLPVRIALDWLAAFVFMIQGNPANGFSVLRAHGRVISNLAVLSSKRSTLREKFPHYSRKCIYRGMILITYYLRGQKQPEVPQ